MADEVSNKAAEVAQARPSALPTGTTTSAVPSTSASTSRNKPSAASKSDDRRHSLVASLHETPEFHASLAQVPASSLVAVTLAQGKLAIDSGKDTREEAKKLVPHCDSLGDIGSQLISVIDLPSDSDLAELQKNCRDVSVVRRYVENGKQGPLNFANNPLARHVHDLSLRGDILVRTDPNNPSHVGKVVPRQLRPRVLQCFHDGPAVQHLGYSKVFDRMKAAVWWPGMDTELRRLCAACARCRQKASQDPPHVRPLEPIMTSYPNETVSLDLFGPFLPSPTGNTYCEVATDLFSKFIMLRAVKNTQGTTSAETLVQWTTRYGAPAKCLTDRGTSYTAEVLKETSRLLGVNKFYTTAGHKEANGQSERLVKTITSMLLSSWTSERAWDEKLPFYEYAYNVSWHPSIDAVPWVLWFSRLPPPLIELEHPGDDRVSAWRYADRRAYAKDTLDSYLEAVHRVRDVHQSVKAQMKLRHNNAIRRFVNLREGDLCYWYDEHVPQRGDQLPARRLFHHWKGPFFVMKIDGANAVIRDAMSLCDKTVHRNLLQRYVYPLAGLELLGQRKNAYVHRVFDVRGSRDKTEYHVEWRSPYGPQLEWLPEELTPGHLIEEYEENLANNRQAQRARRS